MLFFLKTEFEINQHQGEYANNSIADDHRQQSPAKTIQEPNDGTKKNDEHHGKVNVSHTFCFPCLVNLRHKRNTAQCRSG